jgi:hypothetical protein
MRAFYAKSNEEAAELRQDVSRFFNYGSKEWNDFTAAIKRCTVNYDAAFGDGVMPSPGPRGAAVFNDLPLTDDSRR